MKNKVFKGLLLVLGLALFLLPITRGLADAGHNSSYSGGGGGSSWSSGGSSHSSGSSWSSGSSHSSYSSSSSSGDASLGTIVFIIIIIVIFVIIFSRNGSGPTTNNYSIKLLTQEEIDQIDPSIKIQETMDKVFDMFVKEQTDWMNFNYEGLREILSDELFNNYKMQLETMEVGMEKNIMEDIVMVDGGIVSIRNTDLTQELIVKLHVRMKDYIINTATNEPKHGDPKKTMDNNYLITLERSRRAEINNCPNCGGELKDKASQKCKYCDAVLVKGSKDFVIVKQENVQGMYR